MLDLVKFIVESLVDDAGKVEVTQEGHNINIYAAKEEIGKVIGKQGKIAKAIRTVVKAASVKDNSRWSVEIIER
jgi:predicted RNA-binding protein YlqC (UPF0109 family)